MGDRSERAIPLIGRSKGFRALPKQVPPPLPHPQDAFPWPVRPTIDSMDVEMLDDQNDRSVSASEPPWDPPLPRPVPIEAIGRPASAFRRRSSQYDTPDPEFLSQPPGPRPSAARSFFAKLLFVLILGTVVTLLCYEAAIVFRVSWLDPRPLFVKLGLTSAKLRSLLAK